MKLMYICAQMIDFTKTDLLDYWNIVIKSESDLVSKMLFLYFSLTIL